MKMMDKNEYIKKFECTFSNPVTEFDKEEFYVGIDLGTANIVMSIIDRNGNPIAGITKRSTVVRDGIVVDFVEAIRIVKAMKEFLENKLQINITKGYTAIPPGVDQGSVKAIVNVIESAEIDVIKVIDEPTAASYVLEINDGAVVDVGGGTTGISVIKNGDVIFTVDEPTDGTHMSLVLAGNYKISFDEAEELKKDIYREKDIFNIVRPVVEKMATIVDKYLKNYDVDTVYVVGGASMFSEFEEVFEKILRRKVIKPYKPLLVTPLGIALVGLK